MTKIIYAGPLEPATARRSDRAKERPTSAAWKKSAFAPEIERRRRGQDWVVAWANPVGCRAAPALGRLLPSTRPVAPKGRA